MPNQYDVIVIGAGNGGLAAAAYTSKAGLKTLLLEKHNLPGGCATSFRRGRFEFEPSLHELCEYGDSSNPGGIYKMFKELDLDIELLMVPDMFRAVVTGENGYDVTLPYGVENVIKTLEKEFPGCEESVKEFFALAAECGRASQYLGKVDVDPTVLGTEYPNFLRVANLSLDEVLELLDMPIKVRSVLSSYWSYLGIPTAEFDFFTYSMMVILYATRKAYVPKLRSHEMSAAIEKRIQDFGGEIRYNTAVEKILVKDGKAYGVVVGGKEILADHIISNVTPHSVFGKMIDQSEVPEMELKRANARQLGASGLTVYLGLNKSPEELGIKDYSVLISDNLDANALDENMYTLENNGYMIMNCLNIANPECSPEGTSILWATQLFKGDSWDCVAPEEYKDAKNKIAKKLIDRYEEVTGIKISDSIEEISVAAPPTFARYLNTPQGNIYGYQGFMWDNMLSRTMAKSDEHYVDGLRFCGGHDTGLDGYSSAYKNGKTAAELTIKDIKE